MSKDNTHDNEVVYFNDKVTRVTLMARPTTLERSKRFIASAHMERSNTLDANLEPLQIDVG